jgi:uncharacterized RDD family membrane protein YckC
VTYASPTHDPTAVLGRRIGAWFIDLGIYIAFSILIGLAFAGSANAASGQHDLTGTGQTGTEYCNEWNLHHQGTCLHLTANGKETAYTFEVTLYPFLVVAGHMALYAIIQGIFGASLGMLMVGLRVVKSNGEPCGMWRSFVRTFMWIIDAITFTLPVVGGVLMVSTKGHRRAGDMAAGTFVVDKSDAGVPLYIPGLTGTPPPGWEPYGGWPPPAGSGPWVTAPPPDHQTFQGEGPHWDPARDTYIQWDPNVSAWLEWDDTAKAWKPIST